MVSRETSNLGWLLCRSPFPSTQRTSSWKQRLRFLDLQRRLGQRLPRAHEIARIHLKIETGTNRQGVSSKELRSIGKGVLATKFVELVGASTHFANIEDTTDHTFAYEQLSRFNRAVKTLRGMGLEIPFFLTPP